MMRGEFGRERGIILDIDDHRHGLEILRGGADHRGTADIDVLDAILKARAARDRRLERIEIDDKKIDRRDSMRQHRRFMRRIFAHRQEAAMNFRMQASSPARPSFRESR